jgi:hypothetical protein
LSGACQRGAWIGSALGQLPFEFVEPRLLGVLPLQDLRQLAVQGREALGQLAADLLLGLARLRQPDHDRHLALDPLQPTLDPVEALGVAACVLPSLVDPSLQQRPVDFGHDKFCPVSLRLARQGVSLAFNSCVVAVLGSTDRVGC